MAKKAKHDELEQHLWGDLHFELLLKQKGKIKRKLNKYCKYETKKTKKAERKRKQRDGLFK